MKFRDQETGGDGFAFLTGAEGFIHIGLSNSDTDMEVNMPVEDARQILAALSDVIEETGREKP